MDTDGFTTVTHWSQALKEAKAETEALFQQNTAADAYARIFVGFDKHAEPGDDFKSTMS